VIGAVRVGEEPDTDGADGAVDLGDDLAAPLLDRVQGEPCISTAVVVHHEIYRYVPSRKRPSTALAAAKPLVAGDGIVTDVLAGGFRPGQMPAGSTRTHGWLMQVIVVAWSTRLPWCR
jgi:hypothetical protein